MWLLLSPPAQKWGILSFQHIFLFSFLQLHKRVSIKILQKRITEIHSELLLTEILQLVNNFSGCGISNEKKLRFSRKTKKEEIFRNSGGRKAESGKHNCCIVIADIQSMLSRLLS